MPTNTPNAPSRKTASMLRPRLQPISEQDKFQLAKWVLLGVAVLFFLGGIALISPYENGAHLFDACKTILPPIATLVIGYYFSEKGKR